MTKQAKPQYTLDARSVRTLEKLEEHWKVPRSKVLNRCVRIAERNASAISARLDALDRLQAVVKERDIDVAEWAREVRAERWHTNPLLEDDDTSGHEFSDTSARPAIS